MISDNPLFDLQFAMPAPAWPMFPACAARLRGIYAESAVAHHAGACLASALGWRFVAAFPALVGADLAAEQPLIAALEERADDALSYGLMLAPCGPRYILIQLSTPWPLVRYAQPGNPDEQVAELLECLRLGFGQG